MTEAYVNSGDLAQEALALKQHGEEILSLYKGECTQALELSIECLQVSGLNTQEFFKALEKIYTNLSERITTFADFITNVVVVEYEAFNEAITQNFNSNFAQEISSTLGIPMGNGTVRVPTTGETIIEPSVESLDPIVDKTIGRLPKPPLPPKPIDGIPVPREPHNPRYEPVLFEDSTPERTEAGTVSSTEVPTLERTTSLPPIDKGNSLLKPVLFDEGTIGSQADVYKPAVEPKPTIIGTGSTGGTSGTYRGGVSYGGGGGGIGNSAVTYANLDSMSDPLRLNGRI